MLLARGVCSAAAADVLVHEGKAVDRLVIAGMRRTLVETAQFAGDLVEAVKRFGDRILPASFNRVRIWTRRVGKNAPVNQQRPVIVRAVLHRNNSSSQPVKEIQSLDLLQTGLWA